MEFKQLGLVLGLSKEAVGKAMAKAVAKTFYVEIRFKHF